LIQKKTLKNYPFDETLKGYGYEDLFFYHQLLKNGVHVNFINNPVIHLADDTSSEFIIKTEQAMENLHTLMISKKLVRHNSKLLSTYFKLKEVGLQKLFAMSYKIFKPLLLLNLKSSHPSLRLFDIYRLGYFCSIKTPK